VLHVKTLAITPKSAIENFFCTQNGGVLVIFTDDPIEPEGFHAICQNLRFAVGCSMVSSKDLTLAARPRGSLRVLRKIRVTRVIREQEIV